jgi:hypothetical protein
VLRGVLLGLAGVKDVGLRAAAFHAPLVPVRGSA